MSISRSFVRHNPFRVVAGLLAAALLGTSAALVGAAPAGAASDYYRWAIDVNQVKVADAQEENYFWDNGDEVQLGVVAFRTTLGLKNSTRAWRIADLITLCSGADDGRICSVPDSAGRATFGYLKRLTATDIAGGAHPTILGTIQVAIEEDETPDSDMEDILDNLASITAQELAVASESVVPADYATGSGAADRFKAAAKRIKDRAKPRWYEKVGLFLRSWGNPDDLVDFKITALLGVDSDLAGYVDGKLAGVLGDDGFAGALRSQSLVYRHNGDGATDYVTQRVGTY